MKKFILLHRATNNTPIIINTDIITAVYKDTDAPYKTIISCYNTLDISEDENIINIIQVNESVERVYNILYNNIPSENKMNNEK